MENKYEGYSCIFFANFGGKSAGVTKIYYIMTMEDAMKFCADSRTKLSSGSFFFDSLDSFVDKNGVIPKNKIQNDSGKFDELLDELTIQTLTFDEIEAIVSTNKTGEK